MAVTLTQLGAALKLTDGMAEPAEPIRSILSRYLGVGAALVDLLAPGAPEPIQDEAVIRLAAYLYDSPPAASGSGFADAWRNSGASGLVQRWRVVRVSFGEDQAASVPEASLSGGQPATEKVTMSYGMADTRTGPIIDPRSVEIPVIGGVTFEITNSIYGALDGQFYVMDIARGPQYSRNFNLSVLETRPLPSDITAGSAFVTGPEPVTGPRRYSVGPAVTIAVLQRWFIEVD